MPCNDVTEILCFSIDESDVITHYSLDKMSCGGRVTGSDRFGRFAVGRSTAGILGTTSEELLHATLPADSIDEFLFLKHLFSIQLALQALAGQAASGKDAVCSIVSIGHTPEGTDIRARLRVDLVTEEIKASERAKTSFPA